MRLKKYIEKREFSSTPEPKGQKSEKNLKRFVIQHHFARSEHYDFRLEFGGVLLSFAVPKGLSEIDGERRLAVHVEDHPVDYITFEGEIPEGNYGAGKVEIFDYGTYLPLCDMKEGLKKGHIKFELEGKKYNGVWSLVKTDEPNWLIIKSNESEKSIKNKKFPFSKVDVKLATLTEKIPKEGYVFEIKYDGYRMVAFCKNDIKLVSRNHIDYTEKFPNIVSDLKKLGRSAILDGEVVVFDKDGRSDFGLLNEHQKKGENDFCYVVFDILSVDGKDLRNQPLLMRKEVLKEITKDLPKSIIFSEHVKDGEKCFKIVKKLGLEGIVAKKDESIYNGNRDNDWLKIKCYKRQEFVIGGYTTTDKNHVLSAIYVGYYKGNDLIFAGKVGTGFTEKVKNELVGKFMRIIKKSSVFADFDDKNAVFISPKLVAEIQYSEITKAGVLRQPSFIGLRDDKSPKDVTLEGKQ